MVAAKFGLQFHRYDIGSRIRLGHSKRTDFLSADQTRQVFLTLYLRAIAIDLIDA